MLCTAIWAKGLKRTAGLLMAGLLACTGAAWAEGRLQLGNPSVQGDTVTVPVIMESTDGSGVSSLNFSVRYDPAVLEPVNADTGMVALEADKRVSSNMPVEGEYRVLMMGLNQNTVGNGEVAAVSFRRLNAEAGSSNVSITDTTMSAPQGMEIPSRGGSRTIDFDSPGGENADPGDETGDDSTSDDPAEDAPVSGDDDGTEGMVADASGSEDQGETGSQTPAADGGQNDTQGVPGAPGTGTGRSSNPSANRSGGQATIAAGTAPNLAESGAEPGQSGPNVSTVLAEADSARQNIRTPATAGTDSETGRQAPRQVGQAPGGQSTGQADSAAATAPATPDSAPIAGSETVGAPAERTQIAQASAPATAAEAARVAEAVTAGGNEVASAEEMMAGDGNRTLVIGIAVAFAVAAVGLLFFVRQKLFA